MLLYQPEDGYCYNSDSIFLYDFIDRLNPRGRMLDVGAGSGVLGLLVARDNRVELEAVEKQELFAFFSKKNAEVNGIEYKLHQVDFLEFEDDRSDMKRYGYNYIISNPPFYHDGSTKSDNSIKHIARYNEHLPMREFFAKVSKLLRPNGHFVFCYDPQQFQQICHYLSEVKLTVVNVRFIHPKLDRKASLVMVHARKNSNSLMKIDEPFISFYGSEFSLEAQKIYKKARTNSIKCQL